MLLFLETRISDITVEEIFQFGIVPMCVVGIIAVIIAAIVKRRKNAEDDVQPILAENAKVIDKQQDVPGTIAFEMWVMFETESGKRVRLITKPNSLYVVGDEGYLKWQGSRLYSFEIGRRVTNPGASRHIAGSSSPEVGGDYLPTWKRIEIEEARRKAEQEKAQIIAENTDA